MNRPARYVAVIIVALALTLPAMVALSVKMIRLERSESDARARAALEENVRLALWRMDSALAPLFYHENARRTDAARPPAPDAVLDKLVSTHFEVGPNGNPVLDPAGPDQNELLARLTPDRLRHGLETKSLDLIAALTPPATDETAPNSFDSFQAVRNDNEWQSRANYNMNVQTQQADPSPPAVSSNEPDYMVPLWLEDKLVLVRKETRFDGDHFAGCVLSWPELQKWLLGQVRDLLPNASLVPAPDPRVEDRGRLLASLPAKLEPGPVPPPEYLPAAPVALTLAAAWIAFIIAAGAGSFLLLGAVTLSERRAAFVSAVTHELRTPLTTFKMYTEMLADGMVREPEQMAAYLETLRAEADRLGHLVENVLAYSKLEKNRGARIETVAADRLVEGMRELLSTRASRAGMELRVAADIPADVRADPAAVERILYNLVDNSCKYAADAADKTISLEVRASAGKVLFSVTDSGPGIAPNAARRLFRPFSRPAQEAAGNAPGVGLGLALSRSLARFMHGDLSLDPAPGAGARFILSLPGG